MKVAIDRFPGAEFVGLHTNFSPEDFAGMIAKIGLCAGVYAFQVGPFIQTPIRNVILGTNRCINHWVGSWHGDPINDPDGAGLHAIKLLYNPREGDIHVFVKLFAQFGASEYHVLLGAPDPDFVSSSDEWLSSWS